MKLTTILMITMVLACHCTLNAQSKTGRKIEKVGKDVDEANDALNKGKELFKDIFGKKNKKKSKNTKASESEQNQEAIDRIEEDQGNKAREEGQQGLKPGDVHPDAVLLEVDQLSSFNDGAAIVKKGMSTALIDSKGEFITEFNAYNFLGQYMEEGLQNGIFTVLDLNSTSSERGFKGFVDSGGKEISLPDKSYGTWRHLGKYLTFKGQENTTVFYDKTGRKFIISGYQHIGNETMYLRGYQQNSPLFLFRAQNSKFGYKNSKDVVIIQPTWDEANYFSEGAAVVGKKNEFGEMKYGFIDATGKTIVPLSFTNKPDDFSDGLAKVVSTERTCSSCAQKHYGYINKNGEFVINSKNLEHPGMAFSPFFNGYAFSNITVLDKKGNVISYQDFLSGFGISREIMHRSAGVQWNYKYIYDNKMMVSFKGSEGHTYKWYHALLDLNTKETLFLWYADAKIGPFDPISGLALVEEYGEKVRNNRKRVGYINEDGVFMIIKGEASKW